MIKNTMTESTSDENQVLLTRLQDEFRLHAVREKTVSLLKNYPPRYRNAFKKKIYAKAAGKFVSSLDPEEYTVIWRTAYLEQEKFFYHPVTVEKLGWYYRYDDCCGKDQSVWYVNFADPNLFYAYDSGLFAQDEIQTLEHPLLGSIAEYLDSMAKEGRRDCLPLTVENHEPTPILLSNIPYWIKVDTMPREENGQTVSIYGNRFSSAPEDLLDRAVTLHENGSCRSNIIAMAALPGGRGDYRLDQIIYSLKTVISAFQAARTVTGKATAVHTGRWGAGAFGGSEEFALLVQILGAGIAGIERIIFHAVSEDKLAAAEKTAAEAKARNLDALDALADFIQEKRSRWGFSDGN